MGYESELFLCKRKSARSKAIVQLGCFDFCKICYPYWNNPGGKMLDKLFTEPLGTLLVNDNGESVDEDCYGSPLRTAPLSVVMKWLKTFVKNNEEHTYARYALEDIEDKLKGRKDLEKLFFVYYGY